MARRVLYLDYTNGIGMGGGQRSLLLLLESLDRTRFEPVLGCPAGEIWRGLAPADVSLLDIEIPAPFRTLTRFTCGWSGGFRGLLSVVGTAARMREVISKQGIDLVHANNLKMLIVASLANWNRPVPVLWHVRDILPERPVAGWARKAGAFLATRVITVSEAVARQFSSPTEVIHNAVRLPELGRAEGLSEEFRRKNRIPTSAFLFGYVGRMDAGKGIEVLLRAFDSLCRDRADIWLVLAGEGGYEDVLRRLAGELRSPRVVWAGFEPAPERVFAALDCLVAPSTEPDSFPRTVIEAMSWGKPVIGTDSGGIAEAIGHGETGCVATKGDELSLAHWMVWVASNTGTARAWGAAGRRRCEERFGADVQVKRIEHLYEEVLQGAR